MDENLKRFVEQERQRREQTEPAASPKPGAAAVTEAWRANVGNADEYMSLFDLELRITFMNRLQPGVPDVVGLPVLSCIEPSMHEKFLQATAAAYVSGLPHYYETRGTGPGGKPVAYRSWVVPLAGRQGPAAFASVSVDITHLGRVQRELEDQTNVLDTLVRNAPDNITVLDRELRVLFVNHVLEGFSRPEVLGVSISSLFPESHRELVHAKLLAVFESATATSFEAPLEVKGTPRWFSTRVGPILRDGVVERVVLIATDITEARRAAEEHRALEAQLSQAQKMQALGQLTGGIAHDFNNLLTVIAASLSLMKGENVPAKRVRDLALQADSAVERAAALTQRLLAFSRRQSLRPQSIDPRQLLLGMEQLLQRTLPANITPSVQVDPEAWLCRADPVQLESALLNLGINARDAMPRGGTLQIAARNLTVKHKSALAQEGLSEGDYLLIEVTDSGSGMSPEVLTQAFEPFFTTKGVGLGSGLGLSMVYGFAKQSGGQAKLLSQLGMGTTVQLYVPRSTSGVSTVDLPAVTVPSGGAGQLVLVVEDDSDVRRLVCEMLARLGYQTMGAQDGTSAQQALAQHADVALLLLDMVLPGGMSGAELVTELRNGRKDLPVLFMTGYSNDAVSNDPKIRDLKLLAKPFTEAALAAAVADALLSAAKR